VNIQEHAQLRASIENLNTLLKQVAESVLHIEKRLQAVEALTQQESQVQQQARAPAPDYRAIKQQKAARV
jgi:hypothetical protein